MNGSARLSTRDELYLSVLVRQGREAFGMHARTAVMSALGARVSNWLQGKSARVRHSDDGRQEKCSKRLSCSV